MIPINGASELKTRGRKNLPTDNWIERFSSGSASLG